MSAKLIDEQASELGKSMTEHAKLMMGLLCKVRSLVEMNSQGTVYEVSRKSTQSKHFLLVGESIFAERPSRSLLDYFTLRGDHSDDGPIFILAIEMHMRPR